MSKEKKQRDPRKTATSFYIVAVLFYILAIISFFTKTSNASSASAICMGSTFLCVGSSYFSKARKNESSENNGDKENKKEEE